MMGRLEGRAEKLLYEFSLEDAVPSDHLLRKIDRFLDFADLRAHLKPYYSHTGRLSVDPELMIRMLIIGTASASGPSSGYALHDRGAGRRRRLRHRRQHHLRPCEPEARYTGRRDNRLVHPHASAMQPVWRQAPTRAWPSGFPRGYRSF